MSALRKLQNRADHLAECLLVYECELSRSRTLNKQIVDFYAFAGIVNRIDALRRDAEKLLHSSARDGMLARLDKKAASIMRTPAYKVAEWFDSQASKLGWLIGPASIDPTRQARPC